MVAPHSDRRILLPFHRFRGYKESQLPKLLSNQSTSCKSVCVHFRGSVRKFLPGILFSSYLPTAICFNLKSHPFDLSLNPNYDNIPNNKLKLQEKGQTKKKKKRHCSRKESFSKISFFEIDILLMTNFILHRPPSNQSHCHPPDRGRELNGGNLHGTSTRKHLKDSYITTSN